MRVIISDAQAAGGIVAEMTKMTAIVGDPSLWIRPLSGATRTSS